MKTIKDYFPTGISSDHFVPADSMEIISKSSSGEFVIYLTNVGGRPSFILLEPKEVSVCTVAVNVSCGLSWLKSRLLRLLVVNTDPVVRLERLKAMNEVILGFLLHPIYGNPKVAEAIQNVQLVEWSDINYERASEFVLQADDNTGVFSQTLDNVTVTARVLFGLQRVEFELKHVYVSNKPEMVETLIRAFAYPLDGEWEQQINEALGAMHFLAETLRKDEKLKGRVYPEHDFVCEECGAQYQIRVPLTGLTFPQANVQCKECGHVQYVAIK